jgi:hypothetical protein
LHVKEDNDHHLPYFVSATLKQRRFSELSVLVFNDMEKSRELNFEQPR